MFQPGSRRMLHSPSIARTTIVSGGGSRLSTMESNLMGERPYCCVHDVVRPVGYVDAVHVLVVSANCPCTPRLAAAVPRWIEAPGGIVWQTKGPGRSWVPDGRKVSARHEFRQTRESGRSQVPDGRKVPARHEFRKTRESVRLRVPDGQRFRAHQRRASLGAHD